MKKQNCKGRETPLADDPRSLQEFFFDALRDPLKIDGKPLSDSEVALYLTFEARERAAKGQDIDAEKMRQTYIESASNHRKWGLPRTALRLEAIAQFYAQKSARKIIPITESVVKQ